VHGFKPTGLDQLDSTPVSTRSTRYHDTKQIYISSLNASESAKSIFRVPYSLYALLSSYLPGSVLAMATPASANAERATIVATATSNIPQDTAIPQDHRNTNEKHETLRRQKIVVDNAYEHLEWHENYAVLICRTHQFAIKNLHYHLRDYHSGSTKEKKAVVQLFERYQLSDPKGVTLPPPLEEPFASLGKPLNAFICNEPECGYISINRNNVRIHCNQAHNWKSSAKQREHWNSVWVQTFFKSAGLQRYFTVLHDEEENVDGQADGVGTTLQTTSAIEGGTRGVIDNADVETIVTDWKKQEEKLNEELEVADAETAKTDHTL
jgi:hypothetical protein